MAEHNKLGDTLFYLYDLPKDSVTSIQIHESFSKIGIDIKTRPQIKRAHFTPFYSAKVKLNNVTDKAKAKKEFRYPKICGRQCRGLPWIPNVVGQDKRTQLVKNNIFYKFKDRNQEISYEELEGIFSKYGEIQSIKIPIDPNYKQKGFAYILFAKEEDAEKCRAEMKGDESVQEFKQSEPKSEDDKIGNNLYIKNLPENWSDDDIRKLFEKHGKISNFALKQNEFGRYGFVCYDDPEKKDKEYGRQCAKVALETLKDMVMDDKNTKLYIKGFLNMEMRKREKEKETFRFKQSLKRCNLFVKNFPTEWKEEDIMNVFAPFGKIDKIKLNATNNRTGQAFVCFSTPEEAARARSNLNLTNYQGHQIQIVGYELKEDRDLMLEDVRDRKDWENYMSSRGELNTSLAHQPNLAHIIQNLLQLMQQQNADGLKMRQPMRGGPKPGGGRGGKMNMPQGYHNPGMMMQPNMAGMMQPPQAMQQQQQQMLPPNAPPDMIFNHKVREIIPAVQDKNPYLKETVGNFIYDYVLQICGEHRAPKVTGMLIALNAQNIKDYLQTYQHLQAKVQEAVAELDSQPQQQ